MTKAIHGIAARHPTKFDPGNLGIPIRWFLAGLVIFVVTSLINPTGSCAQTRTAPAISESARTTAASLFGDRCAVCHGPDGDGKGPGASNLNPKPVDFRNRKWQRTVTDETIAKVIVYGGPAVGLSSSMAANPDLETQPGVVAALVEHIRSLASKRKQ
jgi:hypothetical protein